MWYLINNDTKYSKGHEFTSTVAARNIKDAEEKFRGWHKINGWDTKWLRLIDYANNKEIKY
jgi:hypothetical protein